MAKIVSVMCMSHSPYLFAGPEDWERARAARAAIPDAFDSSVPIDSAEENTAKQQRCVDAMARLRAVVESSRPDVILVFGDDQLEQFSFQNFPALCLFTGDRFSGYKLSPYAGLPIPGRPRDKNPRTKEHWVELEGHPELARHLMTDLMRQGFDLAFSNEVNEHGIGHAFTRPFVHLRPEYDIPVLPVYINCYYGPQPTGMRCYQFGKAIAEAIESFPGDLRVAVLGSGGLWHTPMVKRAQICKAFDSSVVDAVTSGDAEAMARAFDSFEPEFDPADADEVDRLSAGTGMVLGFGSGTGETRNWIAAAATVDGIPGHMIDYIEINASPIGAGFAYWNLGN